MKSSHRIRIGLAVAAVGGLSFAAVRAQDAPRVMTGFMANILCSATFVSGLNPDEVFAETADAMPGVGLITWAMRTTVDRPRRNVTTTLFGLGRSRAVYREGLGCLLVQGDEAIDTWPSFDRQRQPALLPEIAGPSAVTASNPELGLALDRAFAEPEQPPFRRTKAIVVLKDGRIMAERYAPGYGVDKPILGFSATKSVISALIGILVRQGQT